MKIVLNYAIDHFNINQKKLSISTIAKTINCDPIWGTVPGMIESINSKLVNARPTLRFRRQLSGRYNEIIEEIDSEIPVMAWIDKRSQFQDEVWHVVIINGYDEKARKIYYVDPKLPEDYWQKSEESGFFMQELLGPEGNLIKLKIGSIGQRRLISGGEL
jgi:hypothetical protein